MAPNDMSTKITSNSIDDAFKIPQLECGAMADSNTYAAAPEHNEPLGFPGE